MCSHPASALVTEGAGGRAQMRTQTRTWVWDFWARHSRIRLRLARAGDPAELPASQPNPIRPFCARTHRPLNLALLVFTLLVLCSLV